MSNKILDSPINSNFPKIRKSYSSALEWAILIANGLFVCIGVFICWSIAFTEGTWLFLVNPTIFILLFGAPPFHFVYQWRIASLEYDTSKNVSSLKKLSNHIAIFLAPVILGLWILLFLFLYQFFLDLFEWNSLQSYKLLFWRFTVFLFFVILGPVQFFYIQRSNKINKQLVD